MGSLIIQEKLGLSDDETVQQELTVFIIVCFSISEDPIKRDRVLFMLLVFCLCLSEII